MNNDILLLIADSIGIVAFTLSGLFIAKKNRLDLLGLFIISFLTALGGGVIRDIIIDRPPMSFTHFLPALLVIGVVSIGLLFKLHRKSEIESHYLFIFSDTLGLVSFAITGALLGIGVNFHVIGVMFLALITAVGGGVVRDMLLNEIPLLLKSDFYGSIALLVGIILYILHLANLLNSASILTVFIGGVVLRLIAFYRNWHLPKL
ncbi:MAG: trimeric intracellular cation channel family protein [Sulfurovaceae bacterium]|nr:trimeric intracellular cation channel family protein [Sulfurovaceae bacterium]